MDGGRGGGHALTFYMFLYSFKFEYSLGNELSTLTVNKSIHKKTPRINLLTVNPVPVGVLEN